MVVVVLGGEGMMCWELYTHTHTLSLSLNLSVKQMTFVSSVEISETKCLMKG